MEIFTGWSSFVYNLGLLLYICLVILAIVYIHKINSKLKTEIVDKYPITQQIWFWWIILTFLYTICIFSYNPQSNLNILSRLGGIFGLFAPVGPSVYSVFPALYLIVVLIVIFRMEKKTKQVEKMSAQKKLSYILCVLFILTFFVDLFGIITIFGSYNYFVQYTILNHKAFVDLKNVH